MSPYGFLPFMLKEKLYQYATYSGAKIRKLQVSESEIELIAGDRKTELEVSVERHHGAALYAPYLGENANKNLRKPFRQSHGAIFFQLQQACTISNGKELLNMPALNASVS